VPGVVNRRALIADIQTLKGKRTGFTYKDLARLLRKHGATESGEGGSHRSWSHPLVSNILTLKDASKREVLMVYIMKTRKFLEAILEAL
jgi:predicted RNA binding protein YcfA (HicA-like mRNA interferase family)